MLYSGQVLVINMGESTIIYSGDVSFQVKSLLKTTWVSRFCLLHRRTADSHAYMELFDDKQAYRDNMLKKKTCDTKKIELQYVKSIISSSKSTGKGMEHQIEIKVKSQKHFLKISHDADFNDWLTSLNSAVDIAEHGSASISGDLDASNSDDDDDEVITVNEMYASTDQAQRFVVEVEPSDLAKICGIEGKMTLLIGNNDLAFEDPTTKRIKYSFQFAWLRRFSKFKSQSFQFEAGRKCPNGDGSVRCITDSAKQIHKMVTVNSASRSRTIIPHPRTEEEPRNDVKASRPSVSSLDEIDDPPPPVQERHAAISQPNFASNMQRRHPGKTNTPTLIPLAHNQTDEAKPKTPPVPVRQNSKGKGLRTSGGRDNPLNDSKAQSLEDNEHLRASIYKAAAAGSGANFTKELEKKLHVGNNEQGKDEPEKGHDIGKTDSVKTKEDKKREKEEKKERERREKEEKKEKERLEKERKQREKEEKKSSRRVKNKVRGDIQQEKTNDVRQSMKQRYIYDEAELISPSPTSHTIDTNALYDEAMSPTQFNNPRSGTKEDIYDEATSPSPKTTRKSDIQNIEYAQPYSRKGGVSVTHEPVMYAEVSSVERDAWKKKGRKEEDEFFEENYSSIKSAREEAANAPPPIPTKTYEDEPDDTYDVLQLKGAKSQKQIQPESLYGTASANKVGPLPTTIQIPERDYPSDSEGESNTEEESTYDEAQYEGYEAPADIKKKSKKTTTKVIDSYEDAVITPKPPAPKPSTKRVKRNECLYEEVP